MVNYIEKGYGLHEAITKAGHSLMQVDGVWVASDDVAVQAIIDSYDPLPKAKADAKARLVEQFNAAVADIESQYPEAVKRTFERQESEARTYLADNAANVPTLARIAEKRGLLIAGLAAKVIAKADAYRELIDSLNGDMQAIEDAVDALTDWRAVNQINLGV